MDKPVTLEEAIQIYNDNNRIHLNINMIVLDAYLPFRAFITKEESNPCAAEVDIEYIYSIRQFSEDYTKISFPIYAATNQNNAEIWARNYRAWPYKC